MAGPQQGRLASGRPSAGGFETHPYGSCGTLTPALSLRERGSEGDGPWGIDYPNANSAFGFWSMIFSYWGAVMLPSSFRFRSASISVDWSLWP